MTDLERTKLEDSYRVSSKLASKWQWSRWWSFSESQTHRSSEQNTEPKNRPKDSQTTFDKGAAAIKIEKDNLFNQLC